MEKEAEQALTAEEILLAAQAQVFRMTMGYMGSISLKCAVELDIPDIVDQANGHTISHSNLLSKLPNVPRSKSPFLGRLMRLLAQMGYFKVEEKEETFYSLTPLSTILLKNTPISLSSWVVGIASPQFLDTWQSLGKWLQSEQPGSPFEFEHSMSMWELASLSPQYNNDVNKLMASDTGLTMGVVVDRCKDVFQGLKTLVDVGGGNGTSARTIAQAFPGLKCTIYDLPHVIASVPPENMRINIDAVGGDMFKHIPQADAIFLKCILHDWSDEQCVSILKRCKDAIPAEGGKVIIVDIVVNYDRKNSKDDIDTQLLYDAGMLAFTDGKEREEHEWKKIFNDAGFSNYKITPVGLRSVIELFP